jgi:probable phosphoglycerate mutase
LSGRPRPDILKAGLKLYLVRHGETDWNREARYQGQQDIPLNATGRAQAFRHGELLRRIVPDAAAFDFVSSPLQRSLETMRIIRGVLGASEDDFRIEPLIAELCYGHWEGKLASELSDTDSEGVAAKSADPFHWRPNGGESYSDLETRASRWLETLKRDTIAITHGGVIRVIRGVLFGIEPRLVPFLNSPQDKLLKIGDGAMSWI